MYQNNDTILYVGLHAVPSTKYSYLSGMGRTQLKKTGIRMSSSYAIIHVYIIIYYISLLLLYHIIHMTHYIVVIYIFH